MADGKTWISEDNELIYRALQDLTGGEALKVVEAVEKEDGYRAWQELHKNFEPGLKGRQGRVLTELGDMVRHRSKHISETRTLVTEMMARIKAVEDIIG